MDSQTTRAPPPLFSPQAFSSSPDSQPQRRPKGSSYIDQRPVPAGAQWQLEAIQN